MILAAAMGLSPTLLPAKKTYGIDLSTKAIEHAQASASSHITYRQGSLFALPDMDLGAPFDLIVITGVLYEQYIGKGHQLVRSLVDQKLATNGHLASVHVHAWQTFRFPYLLLYREYYPYREYTHLLEVYKK